MNRLLFLIVFLFSQVLFSQNSSSIQINGGFISKRMSSLGLNSSVQYNHKVEENLELYGYFGYAAWDLYNITIKYNQIYYKCPVEDSHELVSVFTGVRKYFEQTSWFKPFLEAEVGYLYLTYHSYNYFRAQISANQFGFYPDYGTRKTNFENLFGIGFGAGIVHPMSSGLSLVFYYKLNTYLNKNYNGLFTKRGTYSLFNVGFNYQI
ncbi:MAG: hypothetical protein AB1432_13070 [Bacteroidota bacterium]